MEGTNLTTGRLEAVNKLKSNLSITIKPANKGSNVVVMDCDHYDRICRTLLQNKIGTDVSLKTVLRSLKLKFSRLLVQAYNTGVINKKKFSMSILWLNI